MSNSSSALDSTTKSNDTITPKERFSEPSATHYEAPKEPVVSPRGVSIGTALLLANGHCIYRLAPVFKVGQIFAPC